MQTLVVGREEEVREVAGRAGKVEGGLEVTAGASVWEGWVGWATAARARASAGRAGCK